MARDTPTHTHTFGGPFGLWVAAAAALSGPRQRFTCVCAGGGAGAGRARRPPWAQCARAPVTERRSDAGMQLAALHCPSTPPFEMAFSAASARMRRQAMNSAACFSPPFCRGAAGRSGAFSERARQLSLVALATAPRLPPLLSAAPAGRGKGARPSPPCHDLHLMRR